MTTSSPSPAHPTDPVDDPGVPLEVRRRLQGPTWRGRLGGALGTAAALATFVLVVTVLADLPGDPFWVPLLGFLSFVAFLVGGLATGVLLIDSDGPARDVLDRAVRRWSPSSDVPVDLGEVRLTWDGAESAVVHRDGVPVAAVVPDRPVTERLRGRVVAGPTRVQESDAPTATATVRGSGRTWTLTEGTARLQPGRGPAPGGALHHGLRDRHQRRHDLLDLELDGREALAVGDWVLDDRCRWWRQPRPSTVDVRAGRDLVWWAPTDLSDTAVTFLVWRRVSARLLADDHRERERAAQSMQSSVARAML